jgi:hypothetical protein
MVVLFLALPAAAGAKGGGTKTLAPPGNSAVNQYVETVPTAKGGRPTNTIQPHGGRSGGAIPPGTARSLSSLGSDGTGAASFAESTAPGAARTNVSHRSRGHHGHSHSQGAGPGGPSGGSGGNSGGGSPASAVIKTLTGSGGGGGLGVLLPIILAAVAVLGAGLAVSRRRTA